MVKSFFSFSMTSSKRVSRFLPIISFIKFVMRLSLSSIDKVLLLFISSQLWLKRSFEEQLNVFILFVLGIIISVLISEIISLLKTISSSILNIEQFFVNSFSFNSFEIFGAIFSLMQYIKSFAESKKP